MAFLPFATQSYKSRALPVSSQRLVNMFTESQPPDAKSQVVVFQTPGLTQFASITGIGPIRGLWNMGDKLFAVAGGQLWRVAIDGTPTLLGGTISGTSVVSMADNGKQLCIVNGEFGYIWSEDSGFQLITSVNFYPADTVTFFDNYFVFNRRGTNQFFISASLDGTSYSSFDIASAEVNPDFVVGCINQQENLLVFGKRTIETWYDSGDLNFPFARYDGATIERGCIAPLTILKQDNSVFFLGDDQIFYRLNGVIPTRISTHAIEHAWAQYPRLDDAFAFTYTFEGHKFIAITFPSGNATWEYDIAVNLWHERESFHNNTSRKRWRGNACCDCYGKTMIGDAFSGRIGYIDDSTATEFGNLMTSYAVTPVTHADRRRVFMSRFELDIEQGVGVTEGQGSDPQIMLDWSDNGGRSFKNLQIWNSMGKIGEYRRRLRWLRMGSFRNRVYRIVISDPVPRVIISNTVDMKVGSS